MAFLYNTKLFYRVISLLCFCLIVKLAPAQQQPFGRFINYSIKDGLSQNSVQCIYRDTDGLLWIGTQDGLNKFDGKNFTVYSYNSADTNSISDQFVLNIQEDNDGYLWISTRNGFNRFNKKTGIFNRIYFSAKDRHVFQSAVTNFWIYKDHVLVNREGMFAVHRQSLTINRLSNVNGFYTPYAGNKLLCLANNNQTYTANYTDIKLYNRQQIHIPILFNEQATPSSVLYDDSTLLLNFTSRPAIVLDTKRWKILPSQLSNMRANACVKTPGGALLISSNNSVSLCDIRGNIKWQINTSNAPHGIPNGEVLYSMIDQLNNLWVGTSANGLFLSSPSFANFNVINAPVARDIVRQINIWKSRLLISSRTGLYYLKLTHGIPGGNYHTLFSGQEVSSFAVDAKERIWMAVKDKGIVLLSEAGRPVKTFRLAGNNQLPVLHMKLISGNRIVCCTVNGAFIIDVNKEEIISSQVGYVMDVLQTNTGDVWFGSNTGVDIYSNALQKLKSYSSVTDSSSFISNTIVTNVEQDIKGNIWIGTINRGLYKVTGNRVQYYGTKQGLSSNVVFSVLSDDSGRVWVGTSNGLNILDIATNKFLPLTGIDGVPQVAFHFGAKYKLGSNLYLGTSEGLLVIDANQYAVQKKHVQANIAFVEVNGTYYSGQENLSLMPDDKQINIHLGTIPAYLPAQLIFQYRLLPGNSEWVSLPKGANIISYNGLAYGKKQLQVRGAFNTQTLDDAPVYNFSITAKKPFYKTTLALILAALSIVLMAGAGVNFYNKNKYNKKLEELRLAQQLYAERARIGRDLHDNIGAYTSALIAGLNQLKPPANTDTQQVGELKSYAANIMSFLRETIWMLNNEKLTINSFADRISNYVARISKNYPQVSVTCTKIIFKDRELQPTHMLHIFRIIQEALQNALKHADAQNINVSIQAEDVMQFMVSDDGNGFDLNHKDEHYGLQNMKDRAGEMNFIFHINSSANGTDVMLTENTAYAALAQGGTKS